MFWFLLGLIAEASPLDALDDPVLFPPEVMESDPVTAGEIRVQGGGALVLRHTEVVAEVSAGLARVTLTQIFQNPYDAPLEATYLLPLPSKSAVDRMDLTVGDRVVEGIVMERAAARAAYNEAVSDGKRAALLEQQRENLFRQHIAGICPGEAVSVTVSYVEQIEQEDGLYTLSIPTTVGERYHLPWVTDGEAVRTPYSRTGAALDVTVYLDEGLPIEALFSDTAVIEVLSEDSAGATVAWSPEDARPDRDFTLTWSLAGEQPRASVVAHRPRPGEVGTLALSVEPQLLADFSNLQPRELLFVVDSSCSMKGWAHDASGKAIVETLGRARRDDTFNVVSFASEATTLFERPQPVTAANVAAAKAWLTNFDGGATQMHRGIVHSLRLPGDPEALRLVLLLTDGFIDGEVGIFDAVRKNLGSARLFSLGVGSSVNRYLLEGVAEMGRGDVTYLTPGTPVASAVDAFVSRIDHPAMTDVRIDWGEADVFDVYPKKVPDVWAGQPIRVIGRYAGEGPTTVTVTGRVGRERVSLEVPVELPTHEPANDAVAQLWARHRIRDLEWYPGTRTPDQVRDEVIDTALEHNLVSTYTSLVAIDEEPCPCAQVALRVEVPHLAPRGVTGGEGLGGLGAFGTGSSSGYGIGYGGIAGVGILRAQGAGYGGGGSVTSALAGGASGLGTKGVPSPSLHIVRGSSASGFGGQGQIAPSSDNKPRPAPPKLDLALDPGRPSVAAPTLDATLAAAPPPDDFTKTIASMRGQFKYCYERRLPLTPTLAGRMELRFVIGADGRVTEAETVSDTLTDPEVATCVIAKLKRTRFSPPSGGAEVEARIPLLFHP